MEVLLTNLLLFPFSFEVEFKENTLFEDTTCIFLEAYEHINFTR
jgi:hypothetical protein